MVASRNGWEGARQAAELLAAGGSALDAAELGCRMVESDPADHSVGLGGLPNLLGEVELDAAVMVGGSRAAGAVAALQGYEHPVSVARRVMEQMPHVLLVGDGAARFAREQGFESRDLLTPEAIAIRDARLRDELPPEEADLLAYHEIVGRWRSLLDDPERHAGGTVNFLARDRRGGLAAAVSTSGWYFKYPGRVGDSPIVGAGLYADSRYGAAACTGRGELAMRAVTAHSVVTALRHGLSAGEAVRVAIEDADSLPDPYGTGLNVLALDAQGNHAGAANRPGATYVWLAEGMEEPEEVDCIRAGHGAGTGPPPP